MVLLELLEDQHYHQMTSMRKTKKIDFGVLSGPRVGLASVNVFLQTHLIAGIQYYIMIFNKHIHLHAIRSTVPVSQACALVSHTT